MNRNKDFDFVQCSQKMKGFHELKRMFDEQTQKKQQNTVTQLSLMQSHIRFLFIMRAK